MFVAGATNLTHETIICEVLTQSGKVYKIRSFIKNAKLIEINEPVSQNIDLLVSKPETDGFLAIFMFKHIESGNFGDSEIDGLLKNFHNHDLLMTKD